MSGTEEATVNPDGSTTFEGGEDEAFNATAEEEFIGMEEEVVKGIDPAIYLGLFVVFLGLLWFFVLRSRNKEEDEFFAELDVEKVSLMRASFVLVCVQQVRMERMDWEPEKLIDIIIIFIYCYGRSYSHNALPLANFLLVVQPETARCCR